MCLNCICVICISFLLSPYLCVLYLCVLYLYVICIPAQASHHKRGDICLLAPTLPSHTPYAEVQLPPLLTLYVSGNVCLYECVHVLCGSLCLPLSSGLPAHFLCQFLCSFFVLIYFCCVYVILASASDSFIRI